jgi:hypothetical protein
MEYFLNTLAIVIAIAFFIFLWRDPLFKGMFLLALISGVLFGAILFSVSRIAGMLK